MIPIGNLGFLSLAKKSIATIATSLGVLFNNQVVDLPHVQNPENGEKINQEKFQKKILKSKLVLKMNPNNIGNSPLVNHGSHSSHSSHSSHYSSSGFNSSGSSGDGNSNLPYWLIGGGLATYGIIRASKGRKKKK